MNEKQQKVVAWLLSQVGNGYIMGATGQTCTLAFRQQQAKQYATYDGDPNYGATKILGTGAKWDGKPVFDCQGLARRALEQIGIKLPSGATSQWNASELYSERGAIGVMPAGGIPGAQVFRRSKNNAGVMSHVGVYIGDGFVVEALGTANGVIKSKFPGSFTDYAIPHGLLGDEPDAPRDDTPSSQAAWPVPHDTAKPGLGAGQAKVVTTTSGLRLRSLPGKDGARIAELPIGTIVDVLQVEGAWAQVRWDVKPGLHHIGWCCVGENGTEYLQFG